MNDMPIWLGVLVAVLAAVIFGALGIFVGIQRRKKQAEATIGSAEQEAKRIVNDAIKTSETKKKEMRSSKGAKKCTVCAAKPTGKLPTGAGKYSVRNGASSRRKKTWTASWKA